MNAKLVFASLALAAALLPTTVFAQHHGGGHGGGGHSGGGYSNGHAGANVSVSAGAGYHAPSMHGGGYAHVGGRPYYGYGSHHYYGRPYYRSGFYYPRYGHFYGGLAFGLFFASLPLYYDTFWWGGVPYYYSSGTYYLYNDHAHKYEVVAPPYSDEAAAAENSGRAELFVYPKDGQSEEKQRTDRFECHQWAANQSGFDPTGSDASKGTTSTPDKQVDYRRAETACLTGRGYSVK